MQCSYLGKNQGAIIVHVSILGWKFVILHKHIYDISDQIMLILNCIKETSCIAAGLLISHPYQC